MPEINKNARQIIAPILSNKRVGQYHQILISVGEIATVCKPGNFVAISVGGESSRMVLRRAFAISRVSTSSTVGGTLELIVAPHGQGSKWLCAQGEGDVLDLVAPLGTAFGIPTEPVPVLLVGGGYGSYYVFKNGTVQSPTLFAGTNTVGYSASYRINLDKDDYVHIGVDGSSNPCRVYIERIGDKI